MGYADILGEGSESCRNRFGFDSLLVRFRALVCNGGSLLIRFRFVFDSVLVWGFFAKIIWNRWNYGGKRSVSLGTAVSN
jgi:hypothetical protein